jgi:hypothetical protein
MADTENETLPPDSEETSLKESLQRLTDHVNREIGVAQDVPLVERLAQLTQRVDRFELRTQAPSSGGGQPKPLTAQQPVAATRVLGRNAAAKATGKEVAAKKIDLRGSHSPSGATGKLVG